MKFHAESIITEAFLEEKNEKRIIVHVTQRQDLELSVFYDLTFKRDLCKAVTQPLLAGLEKTLIQQLGCVQAWTKKKQKTKPIWLWCCKEASNYTVCWAALPVLPALFGNHPASMRPHLCAATRGRGTCRSQLWEKKCPSRKKKPGMSVSQSVSQSDGQKECTLFPPGHWGQAESPCSRHSNPPGSLSRFGKTTADWCQTGTPT